MICIMYLLQIIWSFFGLTFEEIYTAKQVCIRENIYICIDSFCCVILKLNFTANICEWERVDEHSVIIEWCN